MTEPYLSSASGSPHSEFEEVSVPGSESTFSEAEIIEFDWHNELESVLKESFVDQGMIKSVCKCRNLPKTYRPQVWKVCLNVAQRGNAMSCWDGRLNLSTQDQLQADCISAVRCVLDDGLSAGNSGDEKQMIDDAVAVVTFYSKCRAVKYHANNGWMDILQPLLELGHKRSDLYNCFYAMQSRYIPRSDLSDAISRMPYNLLRLILLYHDPELCNFLDTCKISMESFTKQWFSTLFSSHCSVEVVSAIWDIYLQQGDPFFVFFLALVVLLNAKEQIMPSSVNAAELDQQELITTLANLPSVLSIDDVDDFCQLALYYSDKTPSSFKNELSGCFYSGTMISTSSQVDFITSDLAESFCLKISVPELLLSNQRPPSDASYGDDANSVRFFVVDCRPADQYNKGHLLTAFHLDATLMLREPAEFSAALTALFIAKEQAIQAGSTAGGEHLCFMGSGKEEEDQYMYMVLAKLLQKHQTYVSIARGGYASLLEYFTEVDIDLSEWIVGAERPRVSKSFTTQLAEERNTQGRGRGAVVGALVKRVAGNVRERTLNLKEKVSYLIDIAGDEWAEGERKPEYKKNKPRRDAESVFSIGDENEVDEKKGVSSNAQVIATYNGDEIDDLNVWLEKPEMVHCFECQRVTDDRRLITAHLFVTSSEMRCLLDVKPRSGHHVTKQTFVKAKPAWSLCAIVKITSRKSFPKLLTFKLVDVEELDSDPPVIISSERFMFKDAAEVINLVRDLIEDARVKRVSGKTISEMDENQRSSSNEKT